MSYDHNYQQTDTMSEKEAIDIKTFTTKSSKDKEDVESGEIFHDLDIDPAKEAAVVRKLDLYIMPLFCLIYFLSFLDRSNIGNARVVGLQEQLGLTAHQYSAAVSVFYATYITVELPGTLLVKKIGARRFIAGAMTCWSVVTIFTCFVRSYGTLILCRLLLGLFEGAVFPSQSLYIASTFKREEQTKRLGYLYVCSCISGAFGGLIATAITRIKPNGDFLNWSWLYVIEGTVSFFVAVLIFFALPEDPKTAHFLTDEDKQVMAIRDEQQKKYLGAEKFDKKEVFKAFSDPKLWMSCTIQFCVDLVLYGFSTFLPSILKLQLGYSTLQAQYLTVPVYAVAAISMATVAFVSDRYNYKAPMIIGLNVFSMVGYIILLSTKKGSVNYLATYLIGIALYGAVGLNITWLNNNMAPHYRRATGLGSNQTLGNLAGLVAGQIYTKAPYTLGNSFSLGCTVVAILIATAKFMYLKRENSSKAKILGGEIADTKKDRTGSDSLDFKYVY